MDILSYLRDHVPEQPLPGVCLMQTLPAFRVFRYFNEMKTTFTSSNRLKFLIF